MSNILPAFFSSFPAKQVAVQQPTTANRGGVTLSKPNSTDELLRANGSPFGSSLDAHPHSSSHADSCSPNRLCPKQALVPQNSEYRHSSNSQSWIQTYFQTTANPNPQITPNPNPHTQNPKNHPQEANIPAANYNCNISQFSPTTRNANTPAELATASPVQSTRPPPIPSSAKPPVPNTKWIGPPRGVNSTSQAPVFSGSPPSKLMHQSLNGTVGERKPQASVPNGLNGVTTRVNATTTSHLQTPLASPTEGLAASSEKASNVNIMVHMKNEKNNDTLNVNNEKTNVYLNNANNNKNSGEKKSNGGERANNEKRTSGEKTSIVTKFRAETLHDIFLRKKKPAPLAALAEEIAAPLTPWRPSLAAQTRTRSPTQTSHLSTVFRKSRSETLDDETSSSFRNAQLTAKEDSIVFSRQLSLQEFQVEKAEWFEKMTQKQPIEIVEPNTRRLDFKTPVYGFSRMHIVKQTEREIRYRQRRASSETRLGYLKQTIKVPSSVGKNHYFEVPKWTPLAPSNNVLVIFPGFEEPKPIPSIVKHFVCAPMGYSVYIFNHKNYIRTEPENGKMAPSQESLAPWNQIRADMHRFLQHVISPKSHLFLYARSLGALFLLDYLIHSSSFKSQLSSSVKCVILSKPVLNFLGEEPTSGLNKVSRIFRAFSLKMENRCLTELTNASKSIHRNAAEFKIPLLWLNFFTNDQSNDSTRHLEFYHRLKRSDPDTKKVDYGENVTEDLAEDMRKILNDITLWVRKYEGMEFEEDWEPQCCWTWLPQELKTYIFSFLGTRNMIKAATVCKQWRNLTYISLEEMDLSKTKFQPYLVRHIICYPFLKRLNLKGWLELTDKEVETITDRLTSLESLNLAGCWQITNQAVYLIAEHCHQLHSLSLDSCPKVTNQALVALCKNCPRLKCLHLSKCTQITSEGLFVLAEMCPKIVELNLSYFKLGAIQEALQKFEGLKVLYLEGRLLRTCDDNDPDDKNGDLEGLFKYLPNLEYLSLKDHAKVSSRVKDEIKKNCPNLKQIFI